ncbi:hypothetical protein BKA62DRAFT_673188 [Auriculariales sp. MPI-PUGE-AT-0066]|nr:hypothetical protein BKA62DRAFT_673188 [Auriculariales sp. MPI-PUGE-AT-0066]
MAVRARRLTSEQPYMNQTHSFALMIVIAAAALAAGPLLPDYFHWLGYLSMHPFLAQLPDASRAFVEFSRATTPNGTSRPSSHRHLQQGQYSHFALSLFIEEKGKVIGAVKRKLAVASGVAVRAIRRLLSTNSHKEWTPLGSRLNWVTVLLDVLPNLTHLGLLLIDYSGDTALDHKEQKITVLSELQQAILYALDREKALHVHLRLGGYYPFSGDDVRAYLDPFMEHTRLWVWFDRRPMPTWELEEKIALSDARRGHDLWSSSREPEDHKCG